MAGIQDFISLASKQMNIGEGTAKSATGGLLGAIQQNAAPADFTKLLGALPGASSLVGAPAQEAAPSPGGVGGLMGAVSGLVGGAVGGKAGGAMSLIGTLQRSGLSASQGGDFVKLFLNFVKEKAGPALLGSLTSKMPELTRFAG